MRALIAIVPLALTGCAATSIEAGIGSKLRDKGFYGSGPTMNIRLRHQATDRIALEYQHVSFLTEHGHDEDSLDQASIFLTLKQSE